MRVLVTGGAGYIGSHTVLALLKAGIDVTVFDSFEYGNRECLTVVEKLVGRKVDVVQGDIRHMSDLDAVMQVPKGRKPYSCVVHFAAYKNISDSIKRPLEYYENNVIGSINLVKSMLKHNIKNIIFSSSCAVYGNPEKLPVSENSKYNPMSPYARTKLSTDLMLEDMKNVGLNSVRLRYFNAAGAHSSGLIGENPKVLLNIIPRLFGAALGKWDLKLFGNSFNTVDGSQIRDYVHVVDLADAHVKAISYLQNNDGSIALNLGTGLGTSNLQLIQEVEKVTGLEVKYEVTDPVLGDPIVIYADSQKAFEVLKWKSKYNYQQIIASAWKWYQNCEWD